MISWSKLISILIVLFATSSLLRCTGQSNDDLDESERTILSYIKKQFELFYVPLGACVGQDDQIWTFSMNTESPNTPIVLLHGFGAGIAFWVMNLEEISENRPLYAIDLLGFGKSSRSNFSNNAEIIEEQFVRSIEKWRELMGIEIMVLLGHSFGGYLSSLYALRYPQRIEHLILADPWGFTGSSDFKKQPFWKRVAARVVPKVNALGILRVAGSHGETLIRVTRSGLLKKFERAVKDPNVFAKYIAQCNSNKNPSGERAFRNLLKNGPWPKNPIGEKFKNEIKENVPITFLYGATSWMENKYGEIIKASRAGSYTHIEIVKLAGHHVYADNVEDFNQFVNEAADIKKNL